MRKSYICYLITRLVDLTAVRSCIDQTVHVRDMYSGVAQARQRGTTDHSGLMIQLYPQSLRTLH